MIVVAKRNGHPSSILLHTICSSNDPHRMSRLIFNDGILCSPVYGTSSSRWLTTSFKTRFTNEWKIFAPTWACYKYTQQHFFLSMLQSVVHGVHTYRCMQLRSAAEVVLHMTTLSSLQRSKFQSLCFVVCFVCLVCLVFSFDYLLFFNRRRDNT